MKKVFVIYEITYRGYHADFKFLMVFEDWQEAREYIKRLRDNCKDLSVDFDLGEVDYREKSNND